MGYFQGRLIDHIHLRVADINQSKKFYKAVLTSIDLIDSYGETDTYFYADELFVEEADSETSRVHIAFQATSRDQVDRFHSLAMEAGGTSNGTPGLRDYHKQYYAAYVFDPDGNNIEVVCDQPSTRSSTAVYVERTDDHADA